MLQEAAVTKARAAAAAAAPAADAAPASAHSATAAVQSSLAAAEAEIAAVLGAATVLDEAVLMQVASIIQAATGASGVYIAEKLGSGTGLPPAEGEAPPGGPPTTKIKYVAATPDHAFMKDECIAEGAGVTFKAWIMPEPAPESDDAAAEADGDADAAAAAAAAKPPPELPIVHVPNVLKNNDVFFHRVPKLGAYVAVPFQYGSLLHDGAIAADAAAPAEADDGTVTVPPGTPLTRSLAVCVDTLGKATDFKADVVAALKRIADLLKTAYTRVEAAAYNAEYLTRFAKDAEAVAADATKALADATAGMLDVGHACGWLYRAI
jgi:hypothetical protein